MIQSMWFVVVVCGDEMWLWDVVVGCGCGMWWGGCGGGYGCGMSCWWGVVVGYGVIAGRDMFVSIRCGPDGIH